jgi:ATP-dependent Clp protease adaptor protein ClpS
MPEAMGDSDTLTLTRQSTELDVPWNVVVHDDPVNLMGYVTMVLMKIFGYEEKRASKLMLEVHRSGRSVVWSGQRERAEMHTQQLQAHQLKASIEKSA